MSSKPIDIPIRMNNMQIKEIIDFSVRNHKLINRYKVSIDALTPYNSPVFVVYTPKNSPSNKI